MILAWKNLSNRRGLPRHRRSRAQIARVREEFASARPDSDEGDCTNADCASAGLD